MNYINVSKVSVATFKYFLGLLVPSLPCGPKESTKDFYVLCFSGLLLGIFFKKNTLKLFIMTKETKDSWMISILLKNIIFEKTDF